MYVRTWVGNVMHVHRRKYLAVELPHNPRRDLGKLGIK